MEEDTVQQSLQQDPLALIEANNSIKLSIAHMLRHPHSHAREIYPKKKLTLHESKDMTAKTQCSHSSQASSNAA